MKGETNPHPPKKSRLHPVCWPGLTVEGHYEGGTRGNGRGASLVGKGPKGGGGHSGAGRWPGWLPT